MLTEALYWPAQHHARNYQKWPVSAVTPQGADLFTGPPSRNHQQNRGRERPCTLLTDIIYHERKLNGYNASYYQGAAWSGL